LNFAEEKGVLKIEKLPYYLLFKVHIKNAAFKCKCFDVVRGDIQPSEAVRVMSFFVHAFNGSVLKGYNFIHAFIVVAVKQCAPYLFMPYPEDKNI